ncbi:hypothetical protein Tco_0515326 [Tanacetum coccineum]
MKAASRTGVRDRDRDTLAVAGIVSGAKLLKENVFILDPDGALMSTQEYMQKVVDDVGEDADFNSGTWVSATNYVNAFGDTVLLLFSQWIIEGSNIRGRQQHKLYQLEMKVVGAPDVEALKEVRLQQKVKKDSRKNEFELNKLNALYQRRTQVLERKIEEAARATKKLKKLLESRKAISTARTKSISLKKKDPATEPQLQVTRRPDGPENYSRRRNGCQEMLQSRNTVIAA